MNEVIKIKKEDQNKVFFSSDWHVFHDPKTWASPIWALRGYESAEDAAQKKIDSINSRVGADDILFFLGDGFLNATDEQVKGWLEKINCKNIYYLWGNHESNMFRIYKEEVKRQYGLEKVEIYPLTFKNVIFVGNYLEIKVGKKQIVLGHFSHRIHNRSHHGSWCLSGHSHLSDVGRTPDATLGKNLDVGWDFKNDVWSFAEVEEVMAKKTVEWLDHHDDTTT